LREQSLPKNVEEKLDFLTGKLEELGPPNRRPNAMLSIYALDASKGLFQDIQSVDAPVTSRFKAAVNETAALAKSATDRWKKILSEDVPALNKELEANGLPAIKLAP